MPSAEPRTFVPLVVPGLSSSSTAPQDHLPSISLEPASTRSNEETTEDCGKGVAGNRNGEGIPEWLEDFAETLVIAEVPAPADISHDMDSERPTKMASKNFFTHFRLQGNQDYWGSLLKANWKLSTSGRKKGDLMTADHKVLNEGSESRHNHRYSIVAQD